MSASKTQSRPHAMLDSGIWYGYLLLLISVSFINEPYPSEQWLLITLSVYSLITLAAISASFGGRCNWAAIQSARLPLLVLCLSLVYLSLQQIVPYQTAAHSLLFSAGEQPNWFQPEVVWSVVPSKTRLLLLSELLMIGVLSLSLALISSRERVVQFIVVLTVVCFLHAIAGIAAKFSGVSLVDLKSVDGHFSAARAWFINRNHFAAFISLGLVGALTLQFKLLITANNRPVSAVLIEQLLSPRILYFAFILVGVLALVLSESRAGFLSILISLSIVFWRIGRVATQNLKRRVIAISLLFVLAVVLVYFGGDLLQRFSATDTFLGERTEQWSLTWGAIKAEWLLGYGGNSYADVFQMTRGYADLRDVVFDQAHNDYLHIWLEQGLIGLILWVAFLVLSIRVVVLASAKTSSTLVTAVTLSGLSVIIAALIQSLVDFNLHILNMRYYFFVIMALVMAAPTISQRKRKPG